MSKLVIVESPAKAKTIEKYLGKGYKVIASMGHVRDLPKSNFAVDIDNNFEPKYITIRGKSSLISTLKNESKKADVVYLATDPDREGEAISWHLCSLLGLDVNDKRRVVFNEITKDTIKNAIKNPRKLDISLVDAQQARRVLDRIVGYKLSPFLWKKVKKGLSAGRVQSVATAIIVDREKQIREFVPKEYWTLDANFFDERSNAKVTAKFYGTLNKKIEITNEKQANEIYDKIVNSDFKVSKLTKTEKSKSPAPPFITSTLQQEASRRMNFHARRTMKAAQELYEGMEISGYGTVGLITYMRTDSLRISNEAAESAKDFIISNYGGEFYPAKRRFFKTKNSAQDAHEAIRPTIIELTPDKVKSSLTNDQYRVYKMIYERFIASQMSDAEYDVLNLSISDNKYLFKLTCQSLKFKGYTAVYEDSEKKEDSIDKLYDILENDVMKVLTIDKKQNFTQPPSRYTEASLIKALEENEIGRPSTYVPIITTILSREYVERDGKLLKPTTLGEITTDLMKDHFEMIVDYDFTAKIEKELDKIENGDEEWQKVIGEFYDIFEKTLKKAEKDMEGKRVKIPYEETEEICPNCGKNLVVKSSRYGKFLACPGYPDCKFTKSIVIDTGVKCPKCGGKILKKKSKNSKIYYGCENNPKCDFMTWDEPLKEVCEHCGKNLYQRNGRFKGKYCANTECVSNQRKK